MYYFSIFLWQDLICTFHPLDVREPYCIVNIENRQRRQKSWIRKKALGEWRRLYCCVVVQILPYIFNKCILCILKGLLFDLKNKCAV